MGHTHRKSARMHSESERAKRSRGMSLPRSSGVTVRLGAVALAFAAIALAFAFVYPAAKDSYVAMRAQAQLQAEYDALLERNQTIQANVDRLSTDEGIEDRAREEFGWVKSGENAVNVYGLSEEEGDSSSSLSADVTAGSVPAPQTWYSSVLDPLFGVDPATVAKDR